MNTQTTLTIVPAIGSVHPLSNKRMFDVETGTFYHVGRDGVRKAILAGIKSDTTIDPVLVDPMTKASVEVADLCRAIIREDRRINWVTSRVEVTSTPVLSYLSYGWPVRFPKPETVELSDPLWTPEESEKIAEEKERSRLRKENIAKENEKRISAKLWQDSVDQERFKDLTWDNKCEGRWSVGDLAGVRRHTMDKHGISVEAAAKFLDNLSEHRQEWLRAREDRRSQFTK